MNGSSNARVRTMDMPILDGYPGSWNDCAIGLRSQCLFAPSSFRHSAEFFPALASNIDRSVGSL